MSQRVFTAAGAPLELVEELGRGGEGAVFTIRETRECVAKIYHDPIDQAKQSKLRFMTATHDGELLKYVAWPLETLHRNPGGPVVGFTMNKASAMKPIQSLYSPAQRKHEYPQRAWDFILYAARNTAAAFDVLHERGIVLGDVNQGNAWVGKSALVKLIDADSYQMSTGNSVWLCDVGVAHFTPPELQGASFKGVVRSPSHDNFGLALLIFHLLFGGRHPFAGVPQKDGIGEEIQENIKTHLFAYSTTVKQRLLLPPPNSLPLSIVPPAMARMFDQAFTEAGTSSPRPSAKQWIEELDKLRAALRPCPASKMHIYSAHLNSCPWCALEGVGIIYFVTAPIYGTQSNDESSPVRVGELWIAICKVPPLPELKLPPATNPNPEADPLPLGVFSKTAKRIVSVIVAIAIWALWDALRGPPLLYMFGAAVSWLVIGQFGEKAREEEVQARRAALETAKKTYAGAVQRFRQDAGIEQIIAKRELISRLKMEADNLPAREQKDMATLRSNAEKRQRTAYLERYYISSATIPGIGPGKRAALQSFGIETAAEIEPNRIKRISGFGERLTKILVEWRQSHERNFRFNPATAITSNDTSNVKRSVQKRALEIQALMNQGLKDLLKGPAQQSEALQKHTPNIRNAADKVAQAEADWNALL